MSQLIVKNVSKIFGEDDNLVHALSNVSFDVDKGDFLAIMGSSGSGKTTLLNCISTIDEPTSGDISFEGFDIVHAKDSELADYRSQNISYIFQSYNLVETLTVYENIVLPLQVLEKLSISKLRNKFPNQLSGGQRQRVATARALVDDSKLLIADEPTGALDSANSENLMALLQEINQKFEITIILVTHDPAAAKYSSRMLLLKDGHIIEDLYRNGMSNDASLETIYQKTR